MSGEETANNIVDDASAKEQAVSGEETPETPNGATNEPSDLPADFNLERLLKCFEDCVDKDGKIQLKLYMEGYEELYKFLNLLGTVFGWVSSDVDVKLNVLRVHRKSETAEHYQDVRGMLKYEVDNKLIKPKAKDSGTGARNLLRLHRALEYIVAFLEEVPKLEVNDKCCPASQNAYKATLHKFHPWLVQKAAMLAMHMLPTKAGLIEKICGDDKQKIARAEEALPQAVKAMQSVYNKTDEVFKEYDLLNLP